MIRKAINRRQLLIGTAACAASAQCVAAKPVAAFEQAKRLVAAGAGQVGVTTIYDAAYVRLAFPGGDVPIERGVCTDVVVRAYRQAFAFDLQSAINADMRAAFHAYPRRWGLGGPDPNIDHRRVPNMQVFFTRKGAQKPIPTAPSEWHPGDLVTQMIPGGRPHIGIVSKSRNAVGDRPLIIHNIGRGTQIEDVLDLFPVTGRYAFFPTA